MNHPPNMFDFSEEVECNLTHVDLRRVDPSVNMRRFYSMSLQPDLFGGVDLVRAWGRIGTKGQSLIERHADEQDAVFAMRRHTASKCRRGYKS